MRLETLLVVAVSLTAILGLVDTAPEATTTVAPDDGLEEAMQTINRKTKQLRRKLGEGAEKKELLADVDALESAFLAAKGGTPEKAGELSGAEKARFLAGYRKMMIDSLRLCFDLEEAVIDGKNDDAMKVLRKLNGMKGKGHRKYKN